MDENSIKEDIRELHQLEDRLSTLLHKYNKPFNVSNILKENTKVLLQQIINHIDSDY